MGMVSGKKHVLFSMLPCPPAWPESRDIGFGGRRGRRREQGRSWGGMEMGTALLGTIPLVPALRCVEVSPEMLSHSGTQTLCHHVSPALPRSGGCPSA